MKKILLLALVLGFGVSLVNAQTPATAPSAPAPVTKQTPAAKQAPMAAPTSPAPAPKKDAMKKDTPKAAPKAMDGKAPMKKDGTPDKRYKANQKMKKDGTPDMRYKQNQKKATPATTPSEPKK